MFRNTSRSALAAVAAFGVAASLVACGDKDIITQTNVVVPLNAFVQRNLVADQNGVGAVTVDASLINPWGIAFGPTGALWVANNGTGTATVYDATGVKLTPTTVTIPFAQNPTVTPVGAAATRRGLPTGIVFNSTTDFVIPNNGTAAFIFAGEDGAISAWNTSTGANAILVADASGDGSGYTGITIANDGTANRLYLANFAKNAVDVYDGTFKRIKAFTDSTLPPGYAPFGVANIGGNLYVSYALHATVNPLDDSTGIGNGFVDIFSPNSALLRRLVSAGALNAPWAIVQAPPVGFGPFGGDILVGNFGDGTINAYDSATGALVDVMRDLNGNPIVLQGLWGLSFNNLPGGDVLYFASGPGDETHGLVGTLSRP